MLKALTLRSCANLDNGKIAAAFAIHARKLTDDCMDRPGSNAVRELTIKMMVTPSLDPDTGDCVDVNLEFEIGSKVPKHRSKPINCQVRKTSQGGLLVFNDMNESDIKQRTLDEDTPSFVPTADSSPVDPEDDDDDDDDSEIE